MTSVIYQIIDTIRNVLIERDQYGRTNLVAKSLVLYYIYWLKP